MPHTMPTAADMADVMQAIATGGHQAGFRAIDDLAARLFRHRLFTVLIARAATMEVERAWSSQPAEYPAGGRKPMQNTAWRQQVLHDGALLFCHGEDDIRRTFADHALILSMGIRGMVNTPVRLGGKAVAMLSMSATEDRFTEADAPALHALAGLTLPLVLA